MKSVLAHFASRFIAGETREDALAEVKRLNEMGLLATIDNLGENITDKSGAKRGVEEYLLLLDDIKSAGLNSTVSLKLTHMGLDISRELAEENVRAIVKKAADTENFVRIDMESSAYTERTVELFHSVRKDFDNIGIAIQSYLIRSAKDVERLIETGSSVRLVKGAYSEAEDIAFNDKYLVDENFSMLMHELLLKGKNPAIATHDEELIQEAKIFANDEGLSKNSFEIQMLLGIKRDLQIKLAHQGYKIRVYLPYGPEWLPYTLRRLTERKENLFFVLKNFFH